MISGRELLEVAEFLESMEGESSARSRTGRAYYAAFLEARSYSETHLGYVRTTSGRQHAVVPGLFHDVDPELVVDFAFLRKHRNIADYEIDVSAKTIRRQSALAKTLAHRIIARLDQLANVATGNLTAIDDSGRESPDDA